jgi:hypothetical protein
MANEADNQRLTDREIAMLTRIGQGRNAVAKLWKEGKRGQGRGGRLWTGLAMRGAVTRSH